MKTLYLVRHAKSSWDDMTLSDIDRPLGVRGLRDAPRMAAYLKEKGLKPDALVSSPALRALETATIFGQHFGIQPDDITVINSLYEASPQRVLDVVQKLPDHRQAVMIFGHNPTFTDLANMFGSSYISNVPTAAVCEIFSSANSWATFLEARPQLQSIVVPKMLP